MLDKLNLPWKKTVDPLDNLKSAQLWWKKVQSGDVSSTEQAVAEAVNQFIGGDARTTVSSLQALMWLDDQVQQSYETLCLQYLQNPRMPKTLESKLWHQIMTLAHHMIHAYLIFIKEARENTESSIGPMLPRVLARTLRYLGVQAKWQYFRFLAPEKKFWATIHQLYRLSELRGVDSDSFLLYDSIKARNTSCADEYLQIMMLATINTGALSPRQLDMTDQWLDIWSHHMVMERKFHPGRHRYLADLAGSSPVVKLMGDVPAVSLGRYWGTQDLSEQVTAARNALEGGKALTLDEAFRQPGASELIKLLDAAWSPDPAMQAHRVSDRVQVKKMLDVMYGMKEIFMHVKYDNERTTTREKKLDVDAQEMLDMRQYGFVTERTRQRQAQALAENFQKHTIGEYETWVVNNESDGGYGAVLPVVENDWIRLDVLVGLRPERADHWQLAVVRRLSRVGDGQMYAGLQVLAYSPVAVEIKQRDSRNSGYTIQGVDAATMLSNGLGVFTPAKSNPQKVNGLVMRSADYAQDKPLTMISMGRELKVRTREMLAKGTDWVWARVESDVT